MDFLEKEYYKNTVLQYLIAVGIFVVIIIALRIFRYIILKRVKKWSAKTENTFDDFIVEAIEKTALPLLYFTAFFISANTLQLTEKIQKLLHGVSVVVITFFILRLITAGIKHAIQGRYSKHDESETKIKQMRGIMIIINIVVWVLGLIFLLDNFGYDITAFITGLGIGGIAIALAAQNILGDLFNYFVIFFDRPFEVGDFIVVDDKKGTVEAIGIKTSRIRSLTGEELVFANSDLSGSRIHNYKRMERRRILFSLGVTYQTSLENLRQIPLILRDIITSQEETEFDRAHFQKYGASSLDFEVVYFILNSDYNRYMDIQQAINLRIFEEFEKKGIEFAYPTQTLFLEK
ncbi:MAG: mechanosensitive ion channel family protein [Bacteroidales bacterium]|nr:mechanosensitive ion channel family protein [Bacteroidales bacterium]